LTRTKIKRKIALPCLSWLGRTSISSTTRPWRQTIGLWLVVRDPHLLAWKTALPHN